MFILSKVLVFNCTVFIFKCTQLYCLLIPLNSILLHVLYLNLFHILVIEIQGMYTIHPCQPSIHLEEYDFPIENACVFVWLWLLGTLV